MEPIKSSILCVNLVLSVKIPVKFSHPELIRTIFTRKRLGPGFRNPCKSWVSSTCHKYTTFPSRRYKKSPVFSCFQNLLKICNKSNLHTIWFSSIFFKGHNLIFPGYISLMFNNFILFFIFFIKFIKI